MAIVRYHIGIDSHDSAGKLVLDSEAIVLALADIMSDVVAKSRREVRAQIVQAFNEALMEFVASRLNDAPGEQSVHGLPN